MTYEEYEVRGGYAKDYFALSQRQRLRGLLRHWQRHRNLTLGVPWVRGWYGEPDYRPDDWWSPRYWSWGVSAGQNSHDIRLGPITLIFDYRPAERARND